MLSRKIENCFFSKNQTKNSIATSKQKEKMTPNILTPCIWWVKISVALKFIYILMHACKIGRLATMPLSEQQDY